MTVAARRSAIGGYTDALCVALLVVITTSCSHADDDRDIDDALAHYGAAQAARQRRVHAGHPPIVEQIEGAVRRPAVDGAWVMPMPAGADTLALEIDRDHATVIDDRGAHDARVRWTLPCEIEVSFRYHDDLDVQQPLEIDPVGREVQLVAGVLPVRLGDATFACIDGSLYVRDASGTCTRWQLDDAGAWHHVHDDCGYLTSKTALVAAQLSVREPDLAAARAARDHVGASR